jgi:hypothetical protein
MKMKHLNIIIAAASLSITASAATELLVGQTAWENITTYTNAGFEAWNQVAVIVTHADIGLAASQSGITNVLRGSEDPTKSQGCNDGFYGPDGGGGWATGESPFTTNAYILQNRWLEYSLTNNSTTNLQLQACLLDGNQTFNSLADYTLEYVSGDLDIADGTVVDFFATPGGSANKNNAWGLSDFNGDASLSINNLVDSILEAGQTATFRLIGGSALGMVDNVAFTGEFGVEDIANIPPSFTNSPIATTNGTIDVAYTDTLNGRATDPEGDPIGYALVSGPAWLNLAENGALTGTPAPSDLGVNRFTVNASDSNSVPTEGLLEIIIVDPALEAYDMVGWTGAQNRHADKKTMNISAQIHDTADGSAAERKTDRGVTNETWGSIFMTPVAENNGSTLTAKEGYTYHITITNTSIYDIELEGIYFDYNREFNGSPQDVTVSYVDGDLAGIPLIGGVTNASKNTVLDVDMPFTGLTDKELQGYGEYAVFSLSFANAGGGTANSWIDNLMVRFVKGDPSDRDSDSLADNWEINHFGSITNSDGTADFDNDNYIDYYEFIAGSNPTNALSLLAVEAFVSGTNANEYVIQWQSANGRSYRITSTDNLAVGSWDTTNATGIVATPTTNITTVTSTLSPAFFRVEVE